jgi:hypothetical protein
MLGTVAYRAGRRCTFGNTRRKAALLSRPTRLIFRESRTKLFPQQEHTHTDPTFSTERAASQCRQSGGVGVNRASR